MICLIWPRPSLSTEIEELEFSWSRALDFVKVDPWDILKQKVGLCRSYNARRKRAGLALWRQHFCGQPRVPCWRQGVAWPTVTAPFVAQPCVSIVLGSKHATQQLLALMALMGSDSRRRKHRSATAAVCVEWTLISGLYQQPWPMCELLSRTICVRPLRVSGRRISQLDQHLPIER